MADSGADGKITHALFRRLSGMPRWSSDHWMEDPRRSGGGIFDLHIHDADYVNFLLGMPTAVDARGVEDAHGIGQVMCAYHYPHTQAVFAEGGWCYHDGFPFRMTFTVRFEGATVEYDSARGPLAIFRDGCEPEIPTLPAGDLYTNEIAYFLDCVATGTAPTVVTAFDARETIRLVAAEAASVRGGRPVAL